MVAVAHDHKPRMSLLRNRTDFPDLDRPRYAPPSMFDIYPRYDKDDVKSLVEALGGFWGNGRSRALLIKHRIWVVRRYLIPLVLAWMSPAVAAAGQEPQIRTWVVQQLGHTFGYQQILTAAAAMPAIAGAIVFVCSAMHPRARFFRLMRKAEKAGRTGYNHAAFVRCVHLAGRAARRLFRYLRRGRRSWLAPPAISDIALASAIPIIDVGVPECFNLGTRSVCYDYVRFLRDVSYLVILGEEHLIPRLRSYYGDIARRESNEVSVRRDTLYLDPMRNRHRWEVTREFLYPLSSWLSLAVATIALVLSIWR